MKNEFEYTAKKILAVDDESFILNFVKLVLEREGLQIFTAENGQQALDIASKERPDIIIADLMMPVMDGSELCRRIKQDEQLKETLFIILTAKSGKEDKVKLLNLGADDFIRKPIGKDELVAKVNSFLRIRNLQMTLKNKNKELEKLNSQLNGALNNLQLANLKIKETKDQLLQSEKMAFIGQMTASVAAELEEPVGYVKNNLSVMSNYVTDTKALLSKYEFVTEELARKVNGESDALMADVNQFKKQIDMAFMLSDLDKILEESLDKMRFMERIVKDLNNYARIDDDIEQPVKLNEMLNNILAALPPEEIRDITFEKNFSDLPAFTCYPEKIKQVFTNVLQNAVESIRTSGKIKIETYFSDGLHVRISDNGIGIPKVIQSKIFEPFFTTKEPGKRAGFGLSIVERIVKRHGGDLQLESETGKGTSVTISFPHASVEEQQDRVEKHENSATSYDFVNEIEDYNA